MTRSPMQFHKRSPRHEFRALLTAIVMVLSAGLVSLTPLHAQMPDARAMSGIPRPVDDLPNGSVSVRVIKGDMTHDVPNQPVEMRGADPVKTVNTDADGRAQFDNIAPGTAVSFAAVVDGERLESQQFQMPPQGGIRMLLVATDPAQAAAAKAAAIPGEVVIGGESRFIIEPDEENVSVFYIFDIVNSQSAPVNPSKPFVLTLPSDAVGTTLMEGSSPLASGRGREITINGPFPPGATQIQVASQYPVGNGTVEVSQTFPVALQELALIAKKEGAMQLTSPQIERQQETVTEGTPVIIATGKGIAAGQPLSFTISGLPHHSFIPRNVTLIITGLILIAGAWALSRSASPEDLAAERKKLLARREKLFQDLVRLEHDHKRGKVGGAKYDARREELLQSLEHVYGALEEEGEGPGPATKTGVAA